MNLHESPTLARGASFRIKVENGVVIGRWRYHDDVKFTDSEIAQLDGPLPKIIYIEVTGGRAATSAFVALSAATATAALKAVAERADQLSTVRLLHWRSPAMKLAR
jgi:hypothetical protein